MILGVDIGGANTKITELHENGEFKVHHLYFPMWKNNDKLAEVLKTYSKDVFHVALVTTAELADSYETKKEGVDNILTAVESAFGKNISVFDSDGNFISLEDARETYMKVSASNWCGTAKWVSKNIEKNCILVDMGSTTTDIIPIVDGRVVAEKTDLERLMNQELLYVGTLRTPISHLGNIIMFKGVNTNVSSEYFAITADISVILEKVTPEEYTCDTPDGKGTDKRSSLIRISKVLCSDLNQISESDAENIAKTYYELWTDLILKNVAAVAEKYGLKKVVITGLGENVLKDALADFEVISVAEKYGKDVSLATPSFAVAELLKSELH
ncbi:Hydantoinase/oxoprolinase [Methanococcus maripaludis C5]|uniref:Hydantoinase/oxoprolinase n=1 Tax=Methanococcus maripaludis (strain C5 / ATCC BAA-1333) TaxID=402880 RepID=A4G0B8_METM5|nr:(4-{4-[2-(gamma-L-glutamylamino)ethyl]phenoxymethyl}furan-2-yl)methanamine synthase [Methanococcus maripaludis]ABO35902.1 Hydantoinase/oxoprolinase [Methanococcus maripaludis C5]